MTFTRLTAVTALLCAALTCHANDSTSLVGKWANFPSRFFSKINDKASRLNEQLDKSTDVYIHKILKQEAKLKRKLYKLDSGAARNLFISDPQQHYASYLQHIKIDSSFDPKKSVGKYIPYADSLQGTLSFLNQNPQLLSSSSANSPELQNAILRIQQLQAKMQNTDQLQLYIQQRKQQIKQYLTGLTIVPSGFKDIYSNYNKDQYFYCQQVEAYKDALNDPDKMFKAVLGLLDKIPAFQSFIKSNSILASLFPVPGNYGSVVSGSALQTRDNINQLLQGQLFTPGSMTTFSQNVQDAQSQLSNLKEKMTSLGQGGANMDQPDFIPNTQKTKPFLGRLELGANMQTQHSTSYYPTTTDIGLDVGYKMNDKSTIGIGVSYKIGWGTDIGHIKISSQGLGLRSFLDVKMKGSVYLTGGLEYNYQQVIYSAALIKAFTSWQPSGLVGFSKIFTVNTKLLKKTKVQLLWDFLSYSQLPKTQAFIFRVGYNF